MTEALWAAVVAIGVGTFIFRFSFLFLFDYLSEVPDGIERALRYVPPAVLAALVVPAILVVDGSAAVSPGNERLLAGAVAAAVAWRTESILWTILVGMAALLGIQFVM